MSEDKKIIVEPSLCPKCGNTFHCSTSSKCWCYEYDVPTDVMEQLQDEYNGCLCPECLKEYTR
ncbi:MAG: cysteine-rich CWC family protein [Bacteroidetes bacterium]|nr:cysteine-rich CWC family protein [Bacteroidota bacterium]